MASRGRGSGVWRRSMCSSDGGSNNNIAETKAIRRTIGGAITLAVGGGIVAYFRSPNKVAAPTSKLDVHGEDATVLSRKESYLMQQAVLDANVEAMRRKLDDADAVRAVHMQRKVEGEAVALRRKLAETDEARQALFEQKLEGEASRLRCKLQKTDEERSEHFQRTVESDAIELRRKLSETDEARQALFEQKLEVEAGALRQKLARTDEDRSERFASTVEADAAALRRKLEPPQEQAARREAEERTARLEANAAVSATRMRHAGCHAYRHACCFVM